MLLQVTGNPDTIGFASNDQFKTKGNQGLSREIHVVQEGEAIDDIAYRYNTTPEQIRAWNHLGKLEAIVVFQKLVIRPEKTKKK